MENVRETLNSFLFFFPLIFLVSFPLLDFSFSFLLCPYFSPFLYNFAPFLLIYFLLLVFSFSILTFFFLPPLIYSLFSSFFFCRIDKDFNKEEKKNRGKREEKEMNKEMKMISEKMWVGKKKERDKT